ncbi:MAG: helix-turn-helix transcriptional regulator [Acidobacteria bacterium]|nr:helix-turn-helix transcriptional regulator [Acidobacteriota bacterium]
MDSGASRTSRSDCPVNFAVEILCDKWSLIIMRDILFWGKRTYGALLNRDEGIATNILAARLEYLEAEGLLRRKPDPLDGRKEIFEATERGIDLIPIIVEMVAWSAKHPGWHALNPQGSPGQMRMIRRAVQTKNKYPTIEKFKQIVRDGGYIFEGIA